VGTESLGSESIIDHKFFGRSNTIGATKRNCLGSTEHPSTLAANASRILIPASTRRLSQRELDRDPGRVAQSRHTDMRPTPLTEIERYVLRVLDLRPGDLLLARRIQLRSCRSRHEERGSENAGWTDHAELLRVGRVG
jgi:hypothetical protein